MDEKKIFTYNLLVKPKEPLLLESKVKQPLLLSLPYEPRISDMLVSESMQYFIQTIARDSSVVTSRTKKAGESALIFTEILKHAEKEVKLYSNSLTDDFVNLHDSFYYELHDFLKSGKNLKIALQNPERPKSTFFDILSEYKSNTSAKIEIRSANKAFHANMDDVMKKRTAFIVDDKNAFKLELEASEKHFPQIHDLYSFNDKEISKKLNAAFDDKLFMKCPKLI